MRLSFFASDQGALAQRGDERVTVPAHPVDKVVDTTGAGDVFAGVLAASWDDGPDRAVRRACTAAALATLVPGAGNCAPTERAIAGAVIEGSQ
jgi:ribokinase